MKLTATIIIILFSQIICFSQPSVIDYRYCQSPVKNQADRGTCTAFAVAACLETFPGVPADLSEQYIYAGLKMLDYNTTDTVEQGGLLHMYKESLLKYGFFHERLMPYDPKQIEYDYSDPNLVQVIRESQTGPVSMLLKIKSAKYGISSEADVEWADMPGGKDVDRIKKLLQQGVKAIAVSYTVNLLQFSSLDSIKDALLTPDLYFSVGDPAADSLYSIDYAKNKFGDDLFEKVKNDELMMIPVTEAGGHAMTIVGYNEKGFIVKNSWGKGFGDKGYITISYDYHRLLAKRMFAVKSIRFIPSPKKGNVAALTDLRLKVIPQEKRRGLSLSLFCTDDQFDPLIGSATYTVYEIKRTLKKKLDEQITLAPISGTYDPSLEVTVLENQLPSLDYLTGKSFYQVEVAIPTAAGKPPVKKVYKKIKWINNEYKSTIF